MNPTISRSNKGSRWFRGIQQHERETQKLFANIRIKPNYRDRQAH